jgi:very-short-patch-repair endonuclease
VKQDKALYAYCKKRGYIEHGNVLYPAEQAKAFGLIVNRKKKPREAIKRTGDTDDSRNIKNKARYTDEFIRLLEVEFNTVVYPEFFFSTERLYRFDYALPQYKLAIEVNGGLDRRGKSGHTSPEGIRRDIEKTNLALTLGWRVIVVEPKQKITARTIDLIRKIIYQVEVKHIIIQEPAA